MMQKRWGRIVMMACALVCAAALWTPVCAAEKQRLQVDHYTIDVALEPRTHHLTARAVVDFTALEDVTVAIFELHNGLHVTRALDADGHELAVERLSQDNSLHVTLPNGVNKGQKSSITFEYDGVLRSADDSPAPGLLLAYVGEPYTRLLYAGRWFPLVAYGMDRFSATIHVYAPKGVTVIGSNDGGEKADASSQAAPVDDAGVIRSSARAASIAPRKSAAKKVVDKTLAPASPGLAPIGKPDDQLTTLVWSQASFPGAIYAGPYEKTEVDAVGGKVRVYTTPGKSEKAREYGETAAKALAYFTTLYGVPPSPDLNLIETDDDVIPMSWAPQIAALSTSALSNKQYYRTLANAVSRQWWGAQLSPSTRNDFWISEGGARYSEILYIDYAAGKAAAAEAVKDLEVGALAYDSTPISQSGALDNFDPVFQSATIDKGGVVYHMLRGLLGEDKFNDFMRELQKQYGGKGCNTDQLIKVAETVYGDQLAWFFSQWVDSTGAPEFHNKYTIFRVAKGFRITGAIQQDLDLFRMPVELRIETDGKPQSQIVTVEGSNTAYSVETFGRPRRIVIDPNNWVLKNSNELRTRAAILRGQQLKQQGSFMDALHEFQKALADNRNSSLIQYNIAEVYFAQRNYQMSANSFRDALNGDGQPHWTEVWSHLRLGNIFDITGQRERAINEYRQALQTGDNTQGALDLARKYVQAPFTRERTDSN